MNHSSNNNNGAHFLSFTLLGMYVHYHYVDYCMDRANRTNETLCFGELKHELHCVTIITNFQDGYSWCTLIPVWHTIFFFFFIYIVRLSTQMPFVLNRALAFALTLTLICQKKKITRELRLSHPYNIGTTYLKVCNATHQTHGTKYAYMFFIVVT